MSILSVLKYIAFTITALVAFLGNWIFEFTVTSNIEGEKELTEAGKIGFVIAGIGFVLTLVLNFFEDRQKAQEDKEKAQKEKDLILSLEWITQVLLEVKKNTSKEIQNSIREKMDTLSMESSISSVLKTNPRLAKIFGNISENIRGKDGIIEFIEQQHPNRKFNDKNIYILASFSLRHFRVSDEPEKLEIIKRILEAFEADIIALHEIDDIEIINLIRINLRDYEVLGTKKFGRMIPLLLIKKSRVQLYGLQHHIKGNFTRIPVIQTVIMEDKKFDIVNVHLKSNFGGSEEGIARRTLEIDELFKWIESRRTKDPLVVFGNFNTNLNSPELKKFIENGGLFATEDIPDDVSTFVRKTMMEEYGLRRTTHFYLDDEASTYYIPRSALVYELAKIFPYMTENQIVDKISDHNPVLIPLEIK